MFRSHSTIEASPETSIFRLIPEAQAIRLIFFTRAIPIRWAPKKFAICIGAVEFFRSAVLLRQSIHVAYPVETLRVIIEESLHLWWHIGESGYERKENS